MNVCMAIITVGEHSTKMWNDVFSPSVYAYADRHGYEVRHFTEEIDSGGRPPHWQKLLLAGHPSLAESDRIVYLDSDIMCNPDAPSIAESVPDGKIGAVTWQGSYFNDPAYYDWFRSTWKNNMMPSIREANIQSFADLAVYGGYPANEDWLNSGVLVFAPQHAGFFKNIYNTEPQTETSAFEQQALTHHLCNLRKDLLHPLDRRFNAIWYILREMNYPFISELFQESFVISRCVLAALSANYFLHFAAGGNRSEARNFMRHQHLMAQERAA